MDFHSGTKTNSKVKKGISGFLTPSQSQKAYKDAILTRGLSNELKYTQENNHNICTDMMKLKKEHTCKISTTCHNSLI